MPSNQTDYEYPAARFRLKPPTGDNILPVIIPSFNRLKLLQQTLESLIENTYHEVYPIIVDDGSDKETMEFLEYLERIQIIRLYCMHRRSGVGVCRNFGAAIAPYTSKYIYFSDADVYFTKDWDKVMIKALEQHQKIGILGGQRHPFHGTDKTLEIPHHTANVIELSDQQAGYSMMMRREVWNQVGPFRAADPNAFGAEDTDLCNRMQQVGYLIGSIAPEVVVHCGLTRSDGKSALGVHYMRPWRSKYPHVYFNPETRF